MAGQEALSTGFGTSVAGRHVARVRTDGSAGEMQSRYREQGNVATRRSPFSCT